MFSVAEAIDSGVARGRLHRADLRTPFRGVRASRDRGADGSLLAACLEYAPRLKPWQFFSHETALGLIGAPMPEWPHRPTIHVSAHRPAREPRTEGVRGHRLQVRESAVQSSEHGLPIEHPVRAWRQAGMSWRLDDLIAAGDFLIAGHVPRAAVDDLRTEIEVMGDLRGGLLRRALASVRPRTRSPRETRLRLLIVRGGLPEPETGWVLRTIGGRPIAELDLAYPRWRVAVEYDGRVHAENAVQFAKDADRWDRIRAEGWHIVRILNHHMRGSGATALHKVHEALAEAGWRTGR